MLLSSLLLGSGQALVNPNTAPARRYPDYVCRPSLFDTTGGEWTFDLTGLYREEGYYGDRPDVQWGITWNVCGDSPFICAEPGIAQYVSYGTAIQIFTSEPVPTGQCPTWDSSDLVNCTQSCVPISTSGAMLVTALDPTNVATGGLRLTFPAPGDSPADPFSCNSNANGIPTLRNVAIILKCDNASTATNVTWAGQPEEPTECNYLITGTSAAACGRVVPSPSASPSFTSTASVTGTVTGSATASATSESTGTASGTASSTATATGTSVPSNSNSPLPSASSVQIFGVAASPLDVQVGIGASGVFVGMAAAFLLVGLGTRGYLPWQWGQGYPYRHGPIGRRGEAAPIYGQVFDASLELDSPEVERRPAFGPVGRPTLRAPPLPPSEPKGFYGTL